MQDIEPVHPFETGINIGGDISPRMPDAEVLRRTDTKHIQHITFRLLPLLFRLIDFLISPSIVATSPLFFMVVFFITINQFSKL